MTPDAARAAAELSARASYGRLLAILASSTGDVALAEDALSGALEQALTSWPRAGVPDNPEGWLLTVARNRQRDVWKSAAHRTSSPLDDLGGRAAVDPFADLDPDAVPEARLGLMFVCAHPAIDSGVRTPLMLQTVLGLEAAQIGAVFSVPPATMAQRLVRAKRRIRTAGIPFAVPARTELPERLPAVLEAVYGCYAVGWPDAGRGEVTAPDSLAGEAQYLAVTLADLLSDEPEAWGLAATITLSLARAPARRQGFVPLEEQDPADWDHTLVAEGESYLRRASELSGRDRSAAPGRFQLEAAIQAVHCDRGRTGRTDWAALLTLYTALVTSSPSTGALVARAAVLARVDGWEAGLAALEDVDARELQPWHATRAALLARAGRRQEAAACYERAAELTTDGSTATYLRAAAARARSACPDEEGTLPGADAQPGSPAVSSTPRR